MKTYALTASAVIIGFIYLARQKPQQSGEAASPVNLASAIGEVMNKITGNTPRGIRNNNPLNIEYNERNQWDGQTGTDGRFAQFAEPFYGIRAAAKLLKNYGSKYQANTVRSIIARWAPAVENNVEAYVNSVVKRAGKFPDMYLNEGDYPDVIAAMIYHENGQQPYDMKLIREATAAGFA